MTHFPDTPLPLAATPLLQQLKSVANDLVKQITPITSTGRPSILSLERFISRVDRAEAGQLADVCVFAFEATLEEKLAVLTLTDVRSRVEKVLEILTRQLGILQVSKKVTQNVSNNLSKQQREYHFPRDEF